MFKPRDKERALLFSTFLKKSLIDAGFSSFKHFADASKISKSSVSRMVKGEQIPGVDIIKKISDTLNIPFNELMVIAGYLESNPDSAA